MAGGIRHVRTPEGSKFFGLPIGAPITEHLYQLKKAEHFAAGRQNWPKHMTTTKSSNVEAPHAGTSKASHPSLKGTGTFKVNSGEFHAPSGSKVIAVKNQPGMKFIRTPDGTIHAFNDKGEVDLPDNIQNALQKKFSDDFSGDEKYAVEDLTEHKTPDEAKPDLSSMQAGTVLQDSDGNPVFTKQSDGDWKHEALGIDVSDEDIQDDYDAGDLTVQTPEQKSEAVSNEAPKSFKDMTAEQTKEVLDNAPTGAKYQIVTGQGKTDLEKDANGEWHATTDGVSSTTNSTSVSYLHGYLSEVGDSEPKPEEGSKDSEVPESQPEAPKTPEKQIGKIGQDWSHGDPSKNKTESVGKAEKPKYESGSAYASKAQIDYAQPGDKFHTPHNGMEFEKSGEHPNFDVTVGDTSKKASASYLHHMQKQHLLKSGPLPKAAASTEPKPEEPSKPEPKAPEAISGLVSGPLTMEDIDGLKSGETIYSPFGNKWTKKDDGSFSFESKITGYPIQSSDTDQTFKDIIGNHDDGDPYLWKGAEKAEPEKAPEPNVKGFAVGDSVPSGNSEWYDKAPVGTEVAYFEDSTPGNHYNFVKMPSGAWAQLVDDQGDGFEFDSTDMAEDSSWVVDLPKSEEKDASADLASDSAPSLPKVGEHVLTADIAKSLPSGTVLTYLKKNGTTSEYAKLDNGNFLTPGGGQLDADTMGYNFKNKKMTVKSYPNLGAPGNAPDAPGSTQFVTGGQTYSDKDLKAALDALQGHSGFQISYGLKSVPDNPIAKNQAELKQAAMSAYPDLKPKAAAVAFLQSKLGIATDQDLEALKEKLSDDSPLLTIRAGDDTHHISADQMQKGVDILKAYNGKLFKNELVKNNSPLGKVDWNKAVGFHKDKLEGKQAVIDLLEKKIAAANSVQEAPPASGGPTEKLADWEKELLVGKSVGATIQGWDELDKLPIGSTIHNPENPNLTVWTKTEDGWKNDDELHPSGDQWNFVTSGKASLKSIGDGYVPSPEEKLASALSTNNESATAPDAPLSAEEFKSLPIGSVVVVDISNNTYVKTDENSWLSNASGASLGDGAFDTTIKAKHVKLVSKPDDTPGYAKTPAAVMQKENVDPDSPESEIPNYNQSGLLPGKYSTKNGKAYMIVNADGSGVYVNGKGEVQKLTPGKVKANHKAGMSNFLGVVPENEVPKVTGDSTNVKSVKTKKDVPVTLENGTYFSGTSKDPMSVTYEVDGDKVSIKKANGFVTETTKSKLKTIFANGKILDENGNSVLPENHTGSMYMWGEPTTGQNVFDAHTFLQDYSKAEDFPGLYSTYAQNELATHGLVLSPSKLNSQISKKYGGWTAAQEVLGPQEYSMTWNYGNNPDIAHNKWNEEALKLVQDQLSAFVDHLDTSHPESGAADNFEWGVDGQAQMPLEHAHVLSTVSYWNNSSLTSAYNSIKDSFGDGKTIGQVTLPKNEKSKWLSSYKKGDFKAMYDLEVKAAASKGKVLPNGWKHPGYSGNESTNKIVWGPAVPGEKPAGADLGNSWSDVSPTMWSSAEIDNYLIKAQMQNPTYLTNSEKVTWVYHHKTAGSQVALDQMSIKAALAKQNNSPELSVAPVWTDDIKPAKAYDPVFSKADNHDYPKLTDWTNSPSGASHSWLADNKDNAEFKEWIASDATQSWLTEQGPFGKKFKEGQDIPEYASDVIVGKYFQDRYDAWQEELSKPVYKHVKEIPEGTHTVYFDEDQFGNKFVYKTEAQDKLWRVEQEAAANKLGQLWGYNSPASKIITDHHEDGSSGILQSMVPNTGSLTGVDLTSLSESQLGEVASEHVLDWILDNDDTHADNLLIGNDGHLVGIDKGRGFFIYGNWHGLDPDAMNTNAHTVYSDLFNGIKDGKFSQAQADSAYLSALKAAKRIQKSDDSTVSAIITEGAKNRTSWKSPGYMDHGFFKKNPTNVQELVDSVLDRKANLVDDISGMWKKLYEKQGWDLPEPPAKALGEEHLSGWEEADTIDKAVSSKTFGVSAIHSSGAVSEGYSLLWTEKSGDDTLHFGQFKVGKISAQDIMADLDSKVNKGSVSMSAKSIPNFPDTSDWKHSLSAAGKEATKNISLESPQWDEGIKTNFEKTKEDLKSDLAHWSPDLDADAEGMIHFPSGNSVPEDGLFQYKTALDHYQGMSDGVDGAIQDKVPTSKQSFTQFYPVAYANDPKQYSNEEKWYKQLSNGDYLYFDGQTTKVVSALPADVAQGKGGWSAPVSLSNTDANKYEYVSAVGHSGTLKDGILENSGSSSNGHSGYEYKVTLPTGEVIRIRDHSKTNTYMSQQGLVSFQLSGDDKAASLARVQSYLDGVGVDMSGADENAAELNYWRQMFNRVARSKGGDSKVLEARAALNKKLEEAKEKLGKDDINIFDLSEALSKSMTPAEENKFYRELAESTWGSEKVAKFISKGDHLPQYSHMDLSNPSSANGHAWYKRIDVSQDDLEKTGHLIAVGNTGGDASTLKYLQTGGNLATEERLRLLGTFKQGVSSSADQSSGGASSVFLRVAKDDAHTSGALVGKHRVYYNPGILAKVGTYAFSGDSYGNFHQQINSYDGTDFDVLSYLNSHMGGSNEVMLPNSASLLDSMEIMVFDSPESRNEAVQAFKAAGVNTLRGIPIEDRLVLENGVAAARNKILAIWKSETL